MYIHNIITGIYILHIFLFQLIFFIMTAINPNQPNFKSWNLAWTDRKASCNKWMASCHCSAFSQALMLALKETTWHGLLRKHLAVTLSVDPGRSKSCAFRSWITISNYKRLRRCFSQVSAAKQVLKPQETYGPHANNTQHTHAASSQRYAKYQ